MATTLRELVEPLGVGQADIPPVPILALSADSRTVGPGSLFIAIRGSVSDGHEHIAAALEK
ncbi:MAG: Mur ligase domain-containing protein, partial [Armatimonadota bacterium]